MKGGEGEMDCEIHMAGKRDGGSGIEGWLGVGCIIVMWEMSVGHLVLILRSGSKRLYPHQPERPNPHSPPSSFLDSKGFPNPTPSLKARLSPYLPLLHPSPPQHPPHSP